MSSIHAAGPYALVGIDGGATEVKTHLVRLEGPPSAPLFRLGETSASRKYERVVGFRPVDVAEQLKQRGDPDLTPAEKEQGRRYVEATAQTIVEVARQAGAERVLIGMGMPGLKTPDGRGIAVINNGPRIPDYLDDLDEALESAGITLVAPVSRLGSDADYCGMGEEYAADGLFRDVQNAYYLGGGTGIADAMKLRGQLVPFDEAKPWIHKAWQIPSCLGPTFEKLASALGLSTAYANLLGISMATLAKEERYPEAEALRGDVLAESVLEGASLVLAELIFERVNTIKNGRADVPHRGQAYLELRGDHPYRGTLLDRIVIGQRVGNMYDEPQFADAFKKKLDRCLTRLILNSDDAELRKHYLAGDTVRPGIVVASKLREAPAIGAAIDAVRCNAHLLQGQ